MKPILSCPFCGGSKIEPHEARSHGDPTVHSFVCTDCGARGPYTWARSERQNVNDARLLWNKRDGHAPHEWAGRSQRPGHRYEYCTKCGIVKRADGLNSACRGKMEVTLRHE